jgi:hypothetical protein
MMLFCLISLQSMCRTIDVTSIFTLSLFSTWTTWTADLEPLMPRPKTSTRTPHRLIAHGMGLKQFSSSSLAEQKEQEEVRSRITARQRVTMPGIQTDPIAV